MREFQSESIPCPAIQPEILLRLKTDPLDLEIGAGQGLHAIRYCQNHPQRTLVALERTRDRFHSFEVRAKKHDLQNLIPVRADAVPFVSHFISDQTLDRVFLLYPNPYPKPKQANQRWHRHSFIQCLFRKMKPEATLQIATNMKWYADEAEQWLPLDDHFQLIERRTVTDVPPRTHFEKKYLERGETCFDLVFKRLLQ